jgi:Uri superfamily endonuclease
MKGVYLLVIKINEDITIKIGKLGKINFKKGNYAYIGSAQNNLNKRIERHLSSKKKKHWHIDYLLMNKNVKIEKVFWKKAGKEQECQIANILSKTEKPINHFGCSDCSCISHLFKTESIKIFDKLNMKIIS